MGELTMIQQQRHGGTMPGTLARIVRSRGLGGSGLLRGLIASTGREAVFTAGYLGCLPAAQKMLRDHVTVVSAEVTQAVGAVTTGLLCGAITQPLDTVKTCMQGDLERKKYGKFFGILRTLVKEHGGVRALYRGYFWRSTNIIVDFILLDKMSAFLAPLIFPD